MFQFLLATHVRNTQTVTMDCVLIVSFGMKTEQKMDSFRKNHWLIDYLKDLDQVKHAGFVHNHLPADPQTESDNQKGQSIASDLLIWRFGKCRKRTIKSYTNVYQADIDGSVSFTERLARCTHCTSAFSDPTSPIASTPCQVRKRLDANDWRRMAIRTVAGALNGMQQVWITDRQRND